MAKQGFAPSNSSGRAGRPVLVLGHRGTGVGPGENTLAALREALDLGADGVELDVRRTRDGALAVHHDPVIEGLGPVAELARRDLPASVPTLEAALEACSAGVVNIEVKNLPGEPGYDPGDLTARQVAALLVGSGLVGVIVSSFTATALDAVLSVAPQVATGLLVFPAIEAEAALELAAARGYAAVHPHHLAVTTELVGAAHDAGLHLNTWTVNDAEEAAALVRLGVDALITDRIPVVMAAVDALAAEEEA